MLFIKCQCPPPPPPPVCTISWHNAWVLPSSEFFQGMLCVCCDDKNTQNNILKRWIFTFTCRNELNCFHFFLSLVYKSCRSEKLNQFQFYKKPLNIMMMMNKVLALIILAGVRGKSFISSPAAIFYQPAGIPLLPERDAHELPNVYLLQSLLALMEEEKQEQEMKKTQEKINTAVSTCVKILSLLAVCCQLIFIKSLTLFVRKD